MAVKKGTTTCEAKLYKCTPEYWKAYPKSLRLFLGWLTVLMFSFAFLTIPMCIVFFIPAVWRNAPVLSSICLGSVILSFLMPLKEW